MELDFDRIVVGSHHGQWSIFVEGANSPVNSIALSAVVKAETLIDM